MRPETKAVFDEAVLQSKILLEGMQIERELQRMRERRVSLDFIPFEQEPCSATEAHPVQPQCGVTDLTTEDKESPGQVGETATFCHRCSRKAEFCICGLWDSKPMTAEEHNKHPLGRYHESEFK